MAGASAAGDRDSTGLAGFSRSRVDVDGGWLSCLRRGGAGPTSRSALVLIPGSYDDARTFAGMLERFDADREIVVVELRGHGGSWPPPADGSVEQFAGDVLRAVDALRLRPFFVGGHSIGGMVALQVAAARPSSVRGVIAIEGWTTHRAVEDAFGGDVIGTLSPELLALRQELRRPVMERWTPRQVDEFREIWKRWDGSAFLRTTDLPVLELYGDRGKPRPGRGRLHVPDRDNIELRWIGGASHCLQIEAPAEVARACMEFIRRVENESGHGAAASREDLS